MLISCPECERQVSDRASACPQCGFPIAEEVAKQAQQARMEQSRASRKQVGEVDCVVCEARGFRTFNFADEQGVEKEGFAWCEVCEHSGRVILCEASDGYFAVMEAKLTNFLQGEMDVDEKHVFSLGPTRPQGHRYPSVNPRINTEE